MSEDKIKIKKVISSSSLSSIGPAMEDLGNYPIFSQPVLPPNLDDARIQDKLEALELSIGIKNQKKFVNLGRLDAKGRKARKTKIQTCILWSQAGERG
jgi:hypothetical protein